ncbi:unnamed protein product [Symbiodinium sp. CCMP2592]|nr:unnamed protein product [Symbiodinium sp. CCMP2592]
MGPGRPRGSVERKLADENVHMVLESLVDILLKMKVNLPDLFEHAASKQVKSAGIRELAKSFHWLLKPLLQVCPVPVHTDSLVELVTRLCKNTIYIDETVATTLAMDLKWILTSLRKVRKIWKYNMRGKAGEWPEWASGENFPDVLELVRMMEGFESEEAGSERKLEEVENALQQKRQKVLSDLRHVQISLDDTDEETAASSSSGACGPAAGPHDGAVAAPPSFGACGPASAPHDGALPDARAAAIVPHAAEAIAYDSRPDFVGDVAAFLNEAAPLPPVDVRAQRALAKAAAKPTADAPAGVPKAKAGNKAKAAAPKRKQEKKSFLRKTHKRGESIAYTVHDNMQNKQVVQLVNTYVPDAATKVQTWVDSLNTGTLTLEQVETWKNPGVDLLSLLAFLDVLLYCLVFRLSRLQDHPHFQYMMRFLTQRGVNLRRHDVHLGEYGADTRKPIWLYAPVDVNIPWGLFDLATPSTATASTYYSCRDSSTFPCPMSLICLQTSPRYVDDNGIKRSTGGPGLKASQAYPAMRPGLQI